MTSGRTIGTTSRCATALPRRKSRRFNWCADKTPTPPPRITTQSDWTRNWSPRTTTDFTIGYERVGSLIVPEETAVGPLVLTGFVVEFLGPSSNIPIDRAQNRFFYAARARRSAGGHELTAGSEILRRHVNGSEAESHRGLFFFRNDFGRDAITNIRLGAPSVYRVALGNVHRGFRNWDMQFYVGDRWQAAKRLTLDLGLRYEPVTRPLEVNRLTDIPTIATATTSRRVSDSPTGSGAGSAFCAPHTAFTTAKSST